MFETGRKGRESNGNREIVAFPHGSDRKGWSGSGYSGKPLAQKLGLKSPGRISSRSARRAITVAEDKMHARKR
jgi:hypothetical protein